MEDRGKIQKLTKKEIEEVKGGLLSQYRSLQSTGTKDGGDSKRVAVLS